MCYIISWNTDIDGQVLPISEALDIIIGYGMPSILITNTLILIETEQVQGPAEKYILMKNHTGRSE